MAGDEDLLKPEWLTHKANGAGLQSPGLLAGALSNSYFQLQLMLSNCSDCVLIVCFDSVVC
jgi:hypothetical protein